MSHRQEAPSCVRKILNLIFSKAFEKLVLKKKLFRIVEKTNIFCFLINLPEFLKKIFIVYLTEIFVLVHFCLLFTFLSCQFFCRWDTVRCGKRWGNLKKLVISYFYFFDCWRLLIGSSAESINQKSPKFKKVCQKRQKYDLTNCFENNFT